MAMVTLYYPAMEYQRWHGFVIYQGFAAAFTTINVVGRERLPDVNKFGLFFCIASFLAINIVLLATTSPKNSVTFVFKTFINNTGWKSDSIAFIVGLTNPAFSFGG
jgi:choline transport protein